MHVEPYMRDGREVEGYEKEPPIRARPLTEKQVEEARRVLAAQRSTLPEDGNIGPEGALSRAKPRDAMGHPMLRPRVGS